MMMCVTVLAILGGLLWLMHLSCHTDDLLREADEETGLLGNKVYRIYGCKDARHLGLYDEETDVESEMDKDDEVEEENNEPEPEIPDRASIKMSALSSIRNLDVRRMRQRHD